MTSPAAPPPRRARFGPRYSLRLLLIAFTAFAVGFPVWYRWPYEESVEESIRAPVDPFGLPMPPTKITRRVVTTWQRQWGGRRLKHGPERELLEGKLQLVQNYHNGVLHGMTCRYRSDGSIITTGQFVNGNKSGEWKHLGSHQMANRIESWRDGQLDGRMELASYVRKRMRLEFAKGHLESIDGRAVTGWAQVLLDHQRIDSPQIADELAKLTDFEFVETPLKDAVDFLAEKHAIPIVLDAQYAYRDRPVSLFLERVQLGSALDILTALTDHACDYRYGCLWITSADDAKDWTDPTGVADIVPPKDSQLARSWNEPIDVETIRKPLADAIEQDLIARLAIAVDVSAIRPNGENKSDFTVTSRMKGLPFKHGLGMLLYNTRCRCELRGETLVILPQGDVVAP